MPDVVVIGDANLDLVLRGDVVPRFGQAEQLLDSADLTLGGSGGIIACGLARLGVDVALVAAIGDDAFGQVVLDDLGERGVSTQYVVTRPAIGTGLSVHLSGDDRAILTHLGAISTLTAADIDDGALANARHVHAASPYLVTALRGDLAAVLRRAMASGATTSLDTNDDPTRQWANLADLLGAVDVALPNEGELLAWAGALGNPATTVDEAARVVVDVAPLLAVKLGGDGGAAFRRDATPVRQAATALMPVDTTGAGDSFDAGWIAAILDGADVATALRWAVAAGGMSTAAAGGTSAQGDRAAVTAAAEALPPTL